MTVEQQHAAVLVFHVLVRVILRNIVPGPDRDPPAADTVPGGDVNPIAVNDRCGDDRRAPRPVVAPQDRPVAGRDSRQCFLRQLNQLPLAVELDRHHRGVLCPIGPVGAAPKHLASFFVERRERAAPAARCADHPVAIHEQRLAVTPIRRFATEILHQISAPEDIAIQDIGAHQAALCSERINPVAVHRRRATRPVPPVVAEDAAQRGRPESPPALRLLGKQLLLAVLRPENEQPALGHHRRRVADANVAAQPDSFRPGAWPSLQQAGLAADAVTVGAAPLRPVAGQWASRRREEQSGKNNLLHGNCRKRRET